MWRESLALITYEPRVRFEQRQSILRHNYPVEWADVYLSFDLAGQDPVRRACERTVVGFEWRNLEKLIPTTVGDHRMLSLLHPPCCPVARQLVWAQLGGCAQTHRGYLAFHRCAVRECDDRRFVKGHGER